MANVFRKKKNVISLEILNTLLFSRCQYLLVSCSPYFVFFPPFLSFLFYLVLNTLLFSRCQYLLVSCSPYFIYFIYNIFFLTSLSIHTIVYFNISSIFCHKYICSPIVIGHNEELDRKSVV